MNPSLRILLIDDHHLFRSGLKFLLADLQNDLEFFEAGTCAAALEACNGADLVLLDYHLPDSPGGFTALTTLKERFDAATFVVLSSEDDPNIVIGAIEAGAAGFIPKSSTPDIMIAALKLILAGGTYIPSNALQSAARTKIFVAASDSAVANSAPGESAAATAGTISAQLSERQLQVLVGAIRGKPNKVIARELDIAEGTVKAHLSVAFRVLDVRNRTEAVFMAAKFGIKI